MLADQLWFQIKDSAPLGALILVLTAVALAVGYGLLYVRTGVVTLGGSDGVRALRALEDAPAPGATGPGRVVNLRARVHPLSAWIQAPISGSPVAGYRIIAVDIEKKPREQRTGAVNDTREVEKHRSSAWGTLILDLGGEPVRVDTADLVFAGPPSVVFTADPEPSEALVAWAEKSGLRTSLLGVPEDIRVRLWALPVGLEVGVIGALVEEGEARALVAPPGQSLVVYFGEFEAAKSGAELELP